jgi:hypothetical protein
VFPGIGQFTEQLVKVGETFVDRFFNLAEYDFSVLRRCVFSL